MVKEIQMKAIEDIVAERNRQKNVLGWTEEHDDECKNDQLSDAAACYAAGSKFGKPLIWPWEIKWWKPKSKRENLIKAGALIVAEIERIDRETVRLVKEAEEQTW
jgi:hypothetical protein